MTTMTTLPTMTNQQESEAIAVKRCQQRRGMLQQLVRKVIKLKITHLHAKYTKYTWTFCYIHDISDIPDIFCTVLS